MKYKCSYNSALDIVETVTHGIASFDGLSAMCKSTIELCQKNISANIVVDHSELDAGQITMNEIKKIAGMVASAKDLLGKRKCAHIVIRNLEFGFVRAWEILIELEGVSDLNARPFRSKIDAMEWIKGNS